MTELIAKERDQVIYCVKEPTAGTPVFPSLAGQRVVTTSFLSPDQQPPREDSKEISNTLDVLNRFTGQIGAGSFDIQTYLCPSGVVGTPPMAAILFESAYGVETIGGSDVTYSQAKEKPAFTLWWGGTHTVFFATGAVVESKKLTANNTGGTDVSFSGGFMRRGWAGTSTVAGAVSSSDAVTVASGTGKRYTAEAIIQLGSDNNSGGGYKILSVAGDVLTMAETVSCADGAVISGYLPDLTRVGTPIESKTTQVSFDGSAKVLKTANITYNSPVAWQTEEITTGGYVEAYVEDARSISLDTSALFRENDLTFFYDALNNAQTAVVITIGAVAGKICTFNYPTTELDMPTISSSKPVVNIGIKGSSIGDEGEDSSTIVFT